MIGQTFSPNPCKLGKGHHHDAAQSLTIFPLLGGWSSLCGLTLLLLQVPIGDCLLQHHGHQSVTCWQNAKVATQRLEAEEWLNLLNLLCWKPKLVQMIVMWQGGFPPNTWHMFPLFCGVLNQFLAEFTSLSVWCHWLPQLMQNGISYAFLKLFVI